MKRNLLERRNPPLSPFEKGDKTVAIYWQHAAIGGLINAHN